MKLFRDEQGSVLLFGIGLGVVSLMILTTSVNVATMWVTKSRLNSVADAAALAATRSIDVGQIYQNGISQNIVLSQPLARQRAVSYLNQLGVASELVDFKLEKVDVASNSVSVAVSAKAKLPFGYLLIGFDPTVKAQAKAALNVD